MQRSIETPRPPRSRREQEASIPKFRELRLSAVVAACAWPRTQAAPPRQSPDAKLAARFEED
jgi:hypothetical protein